VVLLNRRFRCPAVRLHCCNGTNGGEGFINLIIKLLPVGDDEEGVMPFELPSGPSARRRPSKGIFLSPECYRRPLASPLVLLCVHKSIEGVIDPRYWWFLATSLPAPPSLRRAKFSTMSRLLAGSPDHRLQETLPSPSEFFFHSEKCSQEVATLPILLSNR